MSGIKIEINTKELREIKQALSRLEKSVSQDTSKVLDQIGNYLDSEVSRRFHDSEGPINGGLQPWKPIREETAEARLGGKGKVYRKDGKFRIKEGISQGYRLSNEKPLIHHEHLLDSITHNVHGNILEHGSTMEYSPFHQFGTETIDARPFIGLTGDDEREIAEIMQRHIKKALES